MKIDENVNMADFCRVPLQCKFVCECLRDMHTFAKDGKAPDLKTTTDLYLQATLQFASRLHPELKYSMKKTDVDHLYGIIEEPLRKHADLAIFGITSSPPKFFFDKDDLDKFGFCETDMNCGFLIQSQTEDKRMKGATRACWAFMHASMLQFFGALGVVRREDVWEHLKTCTLDEQLKSMICFLGGLLGDAKHTHYVNRLMPEGTKLDIRNMITEVTSSLKDDAVTISAVFETQNYDLVDIIRPALELSNVSSSDVHALEWVLENEKYCPTRLK